MVSTRCSVNLGGWDDDSKVEGLFPAPSLVSAGLSVVTQDRRPCPIMEVRPEGRPATLAAHQQHPGQEGAEPLPGKTAQSPEHPWATVPCVGRRRGKSGL